MGLGFGGLGFGDGLDVLGLAMIFQGFGVWLVLDVGFGMVEGWDVGFLGWPWGFGGLVWRLGSFGLSGLWGRWFGCVRGCCLG